MKPVINHAVIVYDGDCVFCSRTMSWIARHDDMGIIRFTPCTSTLGKQLMMDRDIDPDDPTTFLLVVEGRGYVRTEAMLRIVALLDRPARVLGLLRIVPTKLRDAVYDIVARNRRRLVSGACPMPTEDMKRRILQ